MTDTYRVICERCGRVTLTKTLTPVTIYLDREPFTGSLEMARVCPECKAEWVRRVSDFLSEPATGGIRR